MYYSPVDPNCFKSHKNSRCPDFFEKKFCLMSDLKFTLSNKRDIVSTGQSIRSLKIYILRLDYSTKFANINRKIHAVYDKDRDKGIISIVQ